MIECLRLVRLFLRLGKNRRIIMLMSIITEIGKATPIRVPCKTITTTLPEPTPKKATTTFKKNQRPTKLYEERREEIQRQKLEREKKEKADLEKYKQTEFDFNAGLAKFEKEVVVKDGNKKDDGVAAD